MRFTLDHPSDVHMVAAYGHDTYLGWWVEVRRRGRLVESYDELRPGDTSMAGLIRILINQGYFSDLDMVEAADHLQVMDMEEIQEDVGVLLAAEVLLNCKTAAR